MYTFINLTPEPVTLRIEGADLVIQPSGRVAELKPIPGKQLPGFFTRHQQHGSSDDFDPPPSIPVYSRANTQITGLPDFVSDGETLIVTSDVLAACAREEANLTRLAEQERLQPDQYYFSEADKCRKEVLRACVAPGTAPYDEPVTDETGKIIAVTRLIATSIVG